MERQVAVTGLGIISALGAGKEKFYDGLLKGHSVFSSRTFTDERFVTLPALYGAYLGEFSAADYLGRKGLRNLSRESQLFMSAAVMACDDANCSQQTWERQSIGVCGGSVFSGYGDYAHLFADSLAYGVDSINPAQGPQTGFNAPTSQLAIHLRAEGPNITLTTGIASGLDALACAADFIIAQHASMMLAGGVEAHSFFSAQALISTYGINEKMQPPRPFDINRQGPVFGEAAAVVMLEDYAAAHTRGAPILAKVSGYGRAFHPLPVGLERAAERAIGQALREAHLNVDQIDAIIASSNGDRQFDAIEAMALYKSFGERAPVYAVKGAIGECLGASGTLQVAAALLCINQKTIPKTLGCNQRDPALPALSITTETMSLDARHILVHCIDPGGYATTLILSGPERY